ncbi:MAG: radical SAM protein [Oleiphilus sp.]|nr:MAG: radical SAM protein [Oleiphilus sp.]
MLDTRARLLESDFPLIKRRKLETLQVNLGYLCNLSCTHCHVNAGPRRTELMDRHTIDLILGYMDAQHIQCLDLTGGAPELNPHFRYFVEQARSREVHVMDRCNLTVLNEPGQEDLADFLAQQSVEVVASLPCYTSDNVDQQRGKGVFDSSIKALKRLNELGYGLNDKRRRLSLVYNPNGAFLPPPQEQLEHDYKRELMEHFEIRFDSLFTITNMPIARFGSVLLSKGQFGEYMDLLRTSYASENLGSVMCRSLISIDWQGFLYDCDFNQMLHLPMLASSGHLPSHEGLHLLASDRKKRHLSELLDVDLEGQPIVVGDHCYGCTAGQGSSCGGALE